MAHSGLRAHLPEVDALTAERPPAVFLPMRCVLAPLASGPSPERGQLDAVRFLARRFSNARVREVPLLRAAELDLRSDPSGKTRIWLALEALQVTGSFQVRGALVALARAVDGERVPHVVAPSFGNHGVAVAYAACVLGLSATVVVPRTTPRTKRQKIERYGAELVVAATDHYETAEALAKEIAVTQGALFVPPADDIDLVLGNGGSLGFEIVRALGGVPEHVLAPCGAGSLATGIAWALAAEEGRSGERPVWGVQSDLHCVLAEWLEGGAAPDSGNGDCAVPTPEPSGPTLAEELVSRPSRGALARACGAVAGVLVVGEAQIAAAMSHAYRDMGLVLEGTAAAALAPVLFGLPEPLQGGDLVVVLTGRNVDPERLESIVSGASSLDAESA